MAHHGNLAGSDGVRLGDVAGRVTMISIAAAVIGILGTAGLAFGTEHGMERFYHSYLVNFAFFLSLAVGSLFFVMIGHLTRAGWNVAVRRVIESHAMAILPLAILAVIVVLGRHELYEWTHPEVMATDELLAKKAGYLREDFFLVRLAAYFVLWIVLTLFFVRTSRRQDETRDPALTLRMERVAAPGMIAFALFTSFAAFDLLMSLYPHWYSTMYPVYFFAGSALGAFSLTTLTVFLLQSAGKLEGVIKVHHYHDLGKLMFAFVVFWAYIAFSQYMLIWYAAIPEETQWFLDRQTGVWGGLSLFLLFGHFILPFLALVSRHPKRRRGAIALGAVWLLGMHWFDMFWLVMPEKTGPVGNPFHLLDLTIFLALAGVYGFTSVRAMSSGRLVAVGDPRLDESLGLDHA